MVLTIERPSQATQPEPRISMSQVIEPAAVVDHVSKVFIQRPLLRRGKTKEVHAVDDVSFTVGRNEIFGGQSRHIATLRRILTARYRSSRGEYRDRWQILAD